MNDEAAAGSVPPISADPPPSAAGAAPAAAGSTARGAERGARVPSSGRCARAIRRARTAGRRQRRRTTQAQAASEDGSADATGLPATDLRHRTAPHDRVCAPHGLCWLIRALLPKWTGFIRLSRQRSTEADTVNPLLLDCVHGSERT